MFTGDNDPLDENIYRGITIYNVMCKIHESVLASWCTPVIKDKVKLCAAQSACEKGESSTSASLLLPEAMAHCMDNGSNVFETFLL